MGQLKFLPFPSIGSFKNLTYHMNRVPYNHSEHDLYLHVRPKTKLHGTNAAIRIYPDIGIVTAQSRKRGLVIGDDNFGFAAWVKKNEDILLGDLLDLKEELPHCVTIFGEWAGKGIQKSDAISMTDRAFHVFTIVQQDSGGSIDRVVTNPEEISRDYTEDLEETIDNFHVIPWAGTELILNVSNTEKNYQEINHINKMVDMIGERCEYTFKHFGIAEPGEGFVYYSTGFEGSLEACEAIIRYNQDHGLLSWQASFMFKAKCEKHTMAKGARPAAIDPLVLKEQSEFVQRFCTEARLLQGAQEVNETEEYSRRNIGSFIKWVCSDVHKETEVEREEADVNWKSMSKAITHYIKRWYLEKC